MRRFWLVLPAFGLLATCPCTADEPGVLMREGWALLGDRDPRSAPKALSKFQHAATAARAEGDRTSELQALKGVGTAISTMGDLRKAIEIYRQVVDLARTAGDRDMEAFGLREIGLAHSNLGEASLALEPLRQSLEIPLSEGERYVEGKTRAVLGWAYWNVGEYEKTLEHCRSALAIGERFGSEEGQG